VKSWNRTPDDGNPQGSGGIPSNNAPRVLATTFDGPAPVTMQEVFPSGSPAVFLDYNEDSTRWRDHAAGPGGKVFTGLPNGRRGTAHIVTDSADGRVRGDLGLEPSPAGELPGVSVTLVQDAVGHSEKYVTPSPLTGGTVVDSFAEGNPNLMHPDATYNICSVVTRHGGGEPTIAGGPVTANPGPAGQPDTGDPLSFVNADEGTCACRDNNSSEPIPVASEDTATGNTQDHLGSQVDPMTTIQTSGHYGSEIVSDAIRNMPRQAIAAAIPEDVDDQDILTFMGLDGFDPAKVWKLLNEQTKASWRSLSSLRDGCGWSIVFEGDISKPTPGRRGEEAFTEIAEKEGLRGTAEVRNKDWIEAAAKGRDVQWVHDKWGVDFDNKRIYIDAVWTKTAAKTFTEIVRNLRCNPNIKKEPTNLINSLKGFNAAALTPGVEKHLQSLLEEAESDMKALQFWKTLSIPEQRLVTQLHDLELKKQAAIAEAFLKARGLASPGGGKVAITAAIRAVVGGKIGLDAGVALKRNRDAQKRIDAPGR
jgi:hypothetical protein